MMAEVSDQPSQPVVAEDWVHDDVLREVSYFKSDEELQEITWVDRLASKWRVEAPGVSKWVSDEYNGCCLTMYEILVRELDVNVPFSGFEMRVLTHLKIMPSQLHPLSWALMKVFQLCCEYKGNQPSLHLFFTIQRSTQIRRLEIQRLPKRSTSLRTGGCKIALLLVLVAVVLRVCPLLLVKWRTPLSFPTSGLRTTRIPPFRLYLLFAWVFGEQQI